MLETNNYINFLAKVVYLVRLAYQVSLPTISSTYISSPAQPADKVVLESKPLRQLMEAAIVS